MAGVPLEFPQVLCVVPVSQPYLRQGLRGKTPHRLVRRIPKVVDLRKRVPGGRHFQHIDEFLAAIYLEESLDVRPASYRIVAALQEDEIIIVFCAGQGFTHKQKSRIDLGKFAPIDRYTILSEENAVTADPRELADVRF